MKDQLEEIVKEADASLELKLLRKLRQVATEYTRAEDRQAAIGARDRMERVVIALDEAGFIGDWGTQTEAEEAVAPTLSDMVDAVPADAVEGLKPLLRRMAETLGCHHERVTALEEQPCAAAPRYTRDGGNRITMAEIVRQVADKIDSGDVASACDTLDQLLLDGAWSHVLGPDGQCCPRDSEVIKSDLRGLAVAMFAEGRRRAKPEDAPPEPGRYSISREQRQALMDWAEAWDGVCQRLRPGPIAKAFDVVCQLRDMPESAPSPEPGAAPDSESGRPTPAADEIARLTEECERGRGYVKQLLARIEELEKWQ
jgi:hypothetical protein